MAMLLHRTLEPNTHNEDASVVTLYFDDEPTEQEVKVACRENRGDFMLECDTEDKYFTYEEHPTPVSKAAGLHRYECFPTV